MTNAANLVRKQKKKKNKHVRRRSSIRVKGFDEMGPVVQEGFLFAQRGDRVYMKRSHRGDEEVCACTVMSLYENGDVSLYDDTREQWFTFNIADGVNLRSPEIPVRTPEPHPDECKTSDLEPAEISS